MGLNVKDPEAQRLAKAIAKETGDSLTKIVIDSLRERHEKIEKTKRKATFEEAKAIVAQIGRSVRRPYISHDKLLYDKHGLPK